MVWSCCNWGIEGAAEMRCRKISKGPVLESPSHPTFSVQKLMKLPRSLQYNFQRPRVAYNEILPHMKACQNCGPIQGGIEQFGSGNLSPQEGHRFLNRLMGSSATRSLSSKAL